MAGKFRVSPLISVPGVTTKVFRRDWLHNADQGVSSDFLGNVFKVFISRMPGRNQKVRRKALHAKILSFYTRKGVTDKIIGLKKWGVQAPKQPPKLKANAACTRALVPFAYECALEVLDPMNPEHQAITHAAKALLDCYNCLSHDCIDWRRVLPARSADFAVQYKALRAAARTPKSWVIKPKMHQFLEMCSGYSKPNMSWCYRDEDFGGSIAQLCRIKGGRWTRVTSYCRKMLILFKTMNDVPRVGY